MINGSNADQNCSFKSHAFRSSKISFWVFILSTHLGSRGRVVKAMGSPLAGSNPADYEGLLFLTSTTYYFLTMISIVLTMDRCA